MKIYDKIINLNNSVVALGFFDGIHLGHNVLISELIESAKEYNTKSVIITFQKSPAEYFVKCTEYITDNEEKEKLLSNYGVDYLIKLDFDERLKNMSPLEYLEYLSENIHPNVIITGFNHTFGKDKKGTSEFLRHYENIFGYKYIEIPDVKIETDVVSSTNIKNYLQKGDIKSANKFLGRCFKISGEVIEGDKTGRTIGFPTANIYYPEKIVKIPYGVYSCDVSIQNKKHKGILNYGIKPTINKKNSTPVIEVHILSFNKDIYGEKIEIYIRDKIRDEKKFNSLEELKIQIAEDIEKC